MKFETNTNIQNNNNQLLDVSKIIRDKPRNTSADARKRRSTLVGNKEKEETNGREKTNRSDRRLKSIQLFDYKSHAKDELFESKIEKNLIEMEKKANYHAAKRRESKLLLKREKKPNIPLNIKRNQEITNIAALSPVKREFDEFLSDQFVESFDRHFLFSCLPSQQLRIIQNLFKCYEIKAGEKIFRKGEPSNECFFIERGQFTTVTQKKAVTSHELKLNPDDKEKESEEQKKKIELGETFKSPSKNREKDLIFSFHKINTSNDKNTDGKNSNASSPKKSFSSFSNIPDYIEERPIVQTSLSLNLNLEGSLSEEKILITAPIALSTKEKENMDNYMLRRCSQTFKQSSAVNSPNSKGKFKYED